MKTKTYYFDTGVRPELHAKPVPVMPGQVRRGTIQIPFDCDDVPEKAVFRFTSDYREVGGGVYIVREIRNSVIVGKYAFFSIPTT